MVKIDCVSLIIKIKTNNRTFLNFIQLILHALSIYLMILYSKLLYLLKLTVIKNNSFGLCTLLFAMTQLVKMHTTHFYSVVRENPRMEM